MDSKYYIVVSEWNYPTESGREVIADFDTKDEALVRCFELCEDELDNYLLNCGKSLTSSDMLFDEEFVVKDGNIGARISLPKSDNVEWFFHAKVVEVKFG